MIPYGKACYDHVGGDLGAWLYDRVVAYGVLDTSKRNAVGLAKNAPALLKGLGIDSKEIEFTKRKITNPCTDRQTMKEHLGSFLGFLFKRRLAELGWLTEKGGDMFLDPPRLLPEAWKALFGLQKPARQ